MSKSSEHNWPSPANNAAYIAELGYGNLRAVKLFCWHIAHHIHNLQAVLDADRFVVSGGITDEPMFLELLQEAVDR